MNPPPTQPQPDPLDTVSLAIIIRAATDAIPHHPDASVEEKAARRRAAFTMISTLRPRDVMEAMLAARITAVHFHIMDDLRCAAEADLAPSLKLRHRRSAIGLTRMREAAERALFRLQTFPARQPAALPTSIPAERAQPAPAAALSAPARQAAPASRPAVAGQGPAAGPAPRPTTGGLGAPTPAEIEQLVTEAEALLDARAGPVAGDAAGRHTPVRRPCRVPRLACSPGRTMPGWRGSLPKLRPF